MEANIPTLAYFPTTSEILSNESTSCERCGKCFSNSAACRMHIVKSHGIVRNEAEERMKNKTGRADVIRHFYCSAVPCERRFTTMKKLRQHYQKCHMERRLLCPSCNVRRFVLQRDLDYHIRNTCVSNSTIRRTPTRRATNPLTSDLNNTHVPTHRSMQNVSEHNLTSEAGKPQHPLKATRQRAPQIRGCESGVLNLEHLPSGKAAVIIMNTCEITNFLKQMNRTVPQRTVCVQTDTTLSSLSITPSVHIQTPPPTYPMQYQIPSDDGPCFAPRQDGHCQTAPFIQPTRADFGTQIEDFMDTRQVRHVETSMECLDDWRSIETQTMPLLSEGERAAYWGETFGSAETQTY